METCWKQRGERLFFRRNLHHRVLLLICIWPVSDVARLVKQNFGLDPSWIVDALDRIDSAGAPEPIDDDHPIHEAISPKLAKEIERLEMKLADLKEGIIEIQTPGARKHQLDTTMDTAKTRQKDATKKGSDTGKGGHPAAPPPPPTFAAASSAATREPPAAHTALLELVPFFDETKQFLKKVETVDKSQPRLEAAGL
eukprot:SAG31_NODE_5709_length_2368_cov_12.639048_4_plen_196_part_01